MAKVIKVDPASINGAADAIGIPVKYLRMGEVVRKALVKSYQTTWEGAFHTGPHRQTQFTLMNHDNDTSFVIADLAQYSCAGEVKTMIEIAVNYPAINTN